MLDRILENILGVHGPVAYVIVGLLAMLESAAFLGLAVPGELAVILGGVLAYQGNVDPWVMGAVAAGGAIVGDSIGYWIGQRFGPRLLDTRLGRWVGSEKIEKAQAYLRKRGAMAVILGRFTTLLRVLVPTLAGIGKMPYRRFLVANVIGGLAWAATFVALGYAAGGAWKRAQHAAGAAGVILLGILVLAGLYSWAERWVARHPERVRAGYRRFLAFRPVAWIHRHFGAELAYVGTRFERRTALGLRLISGLVIAGAMTWAFGAIALAVVDFRGARQVDLPVALALAEHAAPWLTEAMKVVRAAGEPIVLLPAALVVSLLWRWKRGSWDAAALIALSLGGASVLSIFVSFLVDRPHPPVEQHVRFILSSFPSGEAVRAAAFWGALAHVAAHAWPTWRSGVRAWSAALAVALLVGASGMILGVRYLTDSVAGVALGFGWLAVAASALSVWHRETGRRSG